MRLAVLLGLAVVALAIASPAQAAERTVRYGPFTVPAASGETPGHLSTVRLAVARPCLACFVTSFRPNLVYQDGSTADMSTGMMLHHAVWSSQFLPDATCGGTPLGLAGQRFFATGDERTTIAFPAGYGYRVRLYDAWHMLVELMNMAAVPQTVYVAVTYTYRAPWESVRRVTPVWLDIDQCGDSEYSIPPFHQHWDWQVNVSGRVVAAAGHVHGHGIAVEATIPTQGDRSICRSTAQLSEDLHHVVSMSTCAGDPLARVARGDVVQLHSEYRDDHAADDVMGIMLVYINPD